MTESNKQEQAEQKQDDNQKGDQQNQEQAPPSWLEKAATAVSCLLILILAGALVRDALKTHTPPAFSVVKGKPDVVGDSYRIPIRVYNNGDGSARTVIVHVELKGADTVFSEADLTLDWLPGKSSHSVIGYLKRPSAPHSIEAEVRGYSDP